KGPKRPLNADAYAHHVHNGRLAVAVVDGTGSTPEVAEFAQLAAQVAARVAARRTPVWGVMAAAELCADPTGAHPGPVTNGAIVVATAMPDREWLIAWSGDSDAYGWDADDRGVWRLTTPHTEGQRMREAGEADEEARRHDNVLLRSLRTAPTDGIDAVRSEARYLILASDGLHRLPADEMAAILTEHSDDPETCAQQLVKAGREHSNDDITVLVLQHPHPKDERG
ncbi:Serine/threonine protein phosphatase PrpC, partial [Streptoalloteichus tenebrarius]